MRIYSSLWCLQFVLHHLCFYATDSQNISAPPVVEENAAIVEGDFVIGGLFPVHEKSSHNMQCGEIQTERGIQRMEAMLFTIDHINRNKRLLPHIKLGANVLDTCSLDTYALEQSLEFVRATLSSLDVDKYWCPNNTKAVNIDPTMQVVGIVGAAYSSVSIQVANLLRLFKMPQVSYASTSAALSDKTRFEYFARTVPPDNFQAKAMADIVLYFNWTYVSTVASDGDYGIKGINAFQQEARARNICIAVSETIAQSSSDFRFDQVIKRLRSKTSAKVVMLFLRVEDARSILLAAKRQNATDSFIWVASDGWGKQEMPVKGNAFVAEGALTIELQSTILPEFDTYFKSLKPSNNKRNPWYREFWESVHNCQFSVDGETTIASNVRECTEDEMFTPKIYKQESKIQFVFDAVYAFAHALHNYIHNKCGHIKKRRKQKRCARNVTIHGDLLYNYLLNVSFQDGYGGQVEFDKQGDGLGRYTIFNYRRNRETRKYGYVTVGTWINGLAMDTSQKIMWPGGTYDLPSSQCSEPCRFDQVKHVQQGDVCCWICTTCQSWQFLKDEQTCEDCTDGWWPYPNMTGCYKLEEQYMQWLSVYALVPVCLSFLGITLTIITMATFLKHIDTPVVKATGRDLSFMLLSGCLVCYLMTYLLLAKPSTIVCSLQRIGIGIGFSVIYASLLTKTNRISRIFDSASRSAKRPPFISPKSQIVITLILISIQIAVTCVWLVMEPPGTRPYHPNDRRDQIVLKCKMKDESFLISLSYNMLLIIICTIYAVKTRKIPENFNESKFIGFTMYTTCIIWLAFVPIYFGTLNSFEVQITTLCVSVSLSASVALLCLFTPKMYIIVFQPEKNVRRLTMNSAQYKKTVSGSLTATTSNHGPPSEHIRLNSPDMHVKGACGQTETETDRDSMASL